MSCLKELDLLMSSALKGNNLPLSRDNNRSPNRTIILVQDNKEVHPNEDVGRENLTTIGADKEVKLILTECFDLFNHVLFIKGDVTLFFVKPFGHGIPQLLGFIRMTGA